MKDIIGWEGQYCFDDNTKTVYKILPNGELRAKKAFVNSHGHLTVGLCRHCTQKQYSIHQLVWMYHNDKEVPTGMVLHHIDKNKFHNDISNLRLLTLTEHNLIHYEDHNSVEATKIRSQKNKIKWQDEQYRKHMSEVHKKKID